MKSIARKLSLRRSSKAACNKPSSQKSSTSTPVKETTETKPEQRPEATEPTTETKNMAPSEIPKTYKAAVIEGQQKPLKIEELSTPEVKDGEILVKVQACGVCHSDHHVLNGDMGPPCVQ